MKSLIQLAARTSVQPPWDGRFARRDEPSRAGTQTGTSGETWWTNGVDGRLSVRAVYAIVIGLVVASTVVSIFSTARDISWRLGSPHNLWEPMLWNVTSAIVGVAVLPLVRRGALLFRDRPVRPLTAAAAFVALALAYSALHIAGMGVLARTGLRARRLELHISVVPANSLRIEEGPVRLPCDRRHLLVRRATGRRRAGAGRAGCAESDGRAPPRSRRYGCGTAVAAC